jgi:hypothetical protein
MSGFLIPGWEGMGFQGVAGSNPAVPTRLSSFAAPVGNSFR